MHRVGIFSAALLAWLISLVTLRFGLGEDYFAMFTVALSQVLKYILLNWDYVGGATGIYLTVIEDNFWTLSFVERKPYLYIALVMLVGVILINYSIQRSRMGYYLAAVRENDQAAEALGINVHKVKTQAMIISGGLAGSMGAFTPNLRPSSIQSRSSAWRPTSRCSSARFWVVVCQSSVRLWAHRFSNRCKIFTWLDGR